MHAIRIIIPASSVPLGKKGSGHDFRGTAISINDPRIPDVVYHVTTNYPAVMKSGVLLASGRGGLGGDPNDRIVSFTIDRKIAEQIKKDLRLAAELAKLDVPPLGKREEYGERILKILCERAKEEGWDFSKMADYYRKVGVVLPNYNAMDYLTQYFTIREEKTGIINPVIYSDIETLRNINPNNIEIVEVPKEKLNTGALITDFDLDNPYGLKEIRVYGDVPIDPPKGHILSSMQ